MFTMLSTLYILQSNSSAEPDPIQLLDKAIGKAVENKNIMILFKGIAFGLKDPKSIFNLPANKITKGGYMYLDDNKYELQLGNLKTLSDGKLVVVVDEISQTMFLDSIRSKPLINSQEKHDVNKLMTEIFGEGTFIYKGEEVINKKTYYKIQSSFNNKEKSHVYYWIDKGTEKLFLMAEWQNNAYDVYWFNSIEKAPKKYNYNVNLPDKELEKYYGYNVIDYRFIRKELQPSPKSFSQGRGGRKERK